MAVARSDAGGRLAIRPLETVDAPWALRLNAGDVDKLSPLDAARFEALRAGAFAALAVEDGAGFLMLEDDTGVADLFVPSPWYRKVSIILRRPGAAVTLRCRRTGERTAVAGMEGD